MKRRPPYLSSVLATALVLSLLGAYGLVLVQGRGFLRELRERTSVVVELREGGDPGDAEALGAWLRTRDFVKPGSVEFVSKADGAKLLQAEFGDDFLAFDLDNPLFDLYRFRLPEPYVRPEAIAELRAAVQERPGVLATYVQEDMVDTLARRVDAIAYAGAGIGAALLFGVVFLILNTTRLALLAKATLIKNMELVGASWGFISRPFLRRSVWLGLASGLVAVAITAGIGAFARTRVPLAWQSAPLWQYAALAGALVALGLVLNFLSTLYVVRRTLRLRDDDLATL